MLKLFVILSLMTMIERKVPQSFTTLHSSATPTCFSGSWGNDFTLCGTSNFTKQGNGLISSRKNEELTMTFKPSGERNMSFYDCQKGKRFNTVMDFTYTATDSQITFSWKGTPDPQQLIETTFLFKRSFQFTCKQDTLAFEKDLLRNTMHNRPTYFIRRN